MTWTRTPVAGLAESRRHPLGVVEIRAGQPVQIRSLLAHTIAPSLGVTARYAIELAVRDIGSIRGYAIELGEPVDGMCGPDGGRTGAEQIIADPQVIGVIGTSCSGAAVTASSVLNAAGLAMIAPSNTSPRLTSDLAGNAGPDYHPGYFRVSNNDLYQARALADFAYRELGLRRMATVDDGDPYTTASSARWRCVPRPRRPSRGHHPNSERRRGHGGCPRRNCGCRSRRHLLPAL